MQPPIGASGAMPQTLGIGRHGDRFKSWMLPEAKKAKQLLYVADNGYALIHVFSLPSYREVGRIAPGGLGSIERITTDSKGNLYIAWLGGYNITVYAPGKRTPFLTLTDSHDPDDVAVGANGYVYAGDVQGGIDVYPPGTASPTSRLTNSNLGGAVYGVGVDASNDVYGAGTSAAGVPAVVKFAGASGPGTNLGLKRLIQPSGVFIDRKKDVVVSDFDAGILTYPSGKTSPSSMISVQFAERSGFNARENVICVPQGGHNYPLTVFDYPSGNAVKTLQFGNGHNLSGAALSPAPKP
ncbi:MAG: hypothetical protein WCB99_05680 [Candidatus Cybelea sp.]